MAKRTVESLENVVATLIQGLRAITDVADALAFELEKNGIYLPEEVFEALDDARELEQMGEDYLRGDTRTPTKPGPLN
jgi:hypothetical protein